MADSSSKKGDVFNVARIRTLIKLMEEHDLCELDLRDGDVQVRLARPTAAVAGDARPAVVYQSPAQAPPATPTAAPAEDHLSLIKSPMVGTFYASPNPESPAFVKVGDPVGPDTTVCIIEAMKVFNEIAAELSGRIVSVLVQSGEPVEFGQPLFKVDTRQ